MSHPPSSLSTPTRPGATVRQPALLLVLVAMLGWSSLSLSSHPAGHRVQAAGSQNQAGDSWPQVQKDARHSGYVPQTVGPPYTPLWQRDLFPISSRLQPIVAAGLIFLPSNDSTLYALNTAGGQTVWSYTTGGPLVNSAAYENERVFFGSTDHSIYALNARDGTLVWKYPTGSTVRAAPLLAEGKVFIGSSDGYFYAIWQDSGILAWRTYIGAPVYDTAACDQGQVFFGAMDSVGYALQAASGRVSWQRPIPGQGFRDRWTVAGNGKVFFTPLLLGSHHTPLGSGTSLFHADASPAIYNQPWTVQRQAILNTLAAHPYHQPMFVLNQSDGTPAFTPPVLYASGGSASPHSQPVLLPNGNANIIYRRSFGEPAQWGATTNDALYTGELNLADGDILPVDTCAPGTGGWANCGLYKSPIISDESVALMRSGQILYLDIARGMVGLDTASRNLLEFTGFDRSSGWPFYDPPVLFYGNQNGWVLDYNHLKSEVDSDGNDLKRPTPLVEDTFYILHYNRLMAVRGTLRSSAGAETTQTHPLIYASRAASDARLPRQAADLRTVRQALETHLQKMVTRGHLAPAQYFIGLGGTGLLYATTPVETIYTLSVAYPYLSPALQTRVKQYLQNEIQNYPPYQQGFYPPTTGTALEFEGARREAFAPDPDFEFNFWPGAAVHPVTLYGIWAYASNTGNWDFVRAHYAAFKALYSDLRSTGMVSSYAELAGVIGFARLAQYLGYPADAAEATAFTAANLTRAADFNQFLATARARYPDADHAYTTPVFFFSRVGYHPAIAVHFNRDLGDFLAANAAPAVISYTQQISQAVPLWWLNGPAFSHGENAYAPPEIAWTNFMLHAYVLHDPTATLQEYLDAPDRTGDLFYIQKLVAILDLAAPDLSRSEKTASALTPRPGQVVTYTVALRNDGGPLSNTLYLTDTLPNGLNYLPGTFTATLGQADEHLAPLLRWSGVISNTPAVTLHYAVQVAPGIPVITNTATLRSTATGTLQRQARILVNGTTLYLPVVEITDSQ